MITVFVDSSTLFTAVHSPSGGSAKLFTIKTLHLLTSKLVLVEVERNVRKKLHSHHLERFLLLVEKLDILSQVPEEKLMVSAKKVIVEKDAAILAETKQSKTEFLVTLDRKHFHTPQVAKFLQPQKVVTPKLLLEFMKKK